MAVCCKYGNENLTSFMNNHERPEGGGEGGPLPPSPAPLGCLKIVCIWTFLRKQYVFLMFAPTWKFPPPVKSLRTPM
jgi:hypothetical protein